MTLAFLHSFHYFVSVGIYISAQARKLETGQPVKRLNHNVLVLRFDKLLGEYVNDLAIDYKIVCGRS